MGSLRTTIELSTLVSECLENRRLRLGQRSDGTCCNPVCSSFDRALSGAHFGGSRTRAEWCCRLGDPASFAAREVSTVGLDGFSP
jgi:hypothetical protein